MEELIRELNNPSNARFPNRINDIQREIQRLQREKSAWQLGLDLLQHQEATVRFYGALTLTIKINADWDPDQVSVNEDMKAYLLESLLRSYVRLTLASDEKFVLQRLVSTLVTFFLKADSNWMLALRHTLACLISGDYVPQNNLPSVRTMLDNNENVSIGSLKGLMMFALTLAEEDTNGMGLDTKEINLLEKRIAANCADAWQAISYCLSRYADSELDGVTSSESGKMNKELVEITNMSLQAIPHWSDFVRDVYENDIQDAEQYSHSAVLTAIGCMNRKKFSATAVEILTSLHQMNRQLLWRSDPQFSHSVMASPQARQWILNLLDGDFSQEAVQYVELLVSLAGQVAFSSPDWWKSDINREIFDTLEQLLHCPGAAILEDEVCRIVFDCFTEIAETYSDLLGSQYKNELVEQYLARCCSACLMKIRIPSEELTTETQSWDADDRSRFQNFRYDVSDFFQTAFGILGTALMEEIAKPILVCQETSNWSNFESALFALTSFSDTMSNEPEKYDSFIMAIFASKQWSETMEATNPVPDRVRQTSIKFISEVTGYLQRHSASLVPSLNFLFLSLHLPASASAASRAIYTLCDSERLALVEALPQFLGSLSTISDLGANDQHRIYGGVAAIIQALPTEEAKVQPLLQILDMVARFETQGLSGKAEDESQLEFCTNIMQTLAAIGKGLRAPVDTPVDLDADESENEHFWTAGGGVVVQQRTLKTYEAVFQQSASQVDHTFIEAACGVIRSGFTEDHPSPFKFSNPVVLQLLNQHINLDCPNIDAVMSCASGFLASAKIAELGHGLMDLLLPLSQLQQKIITEYDQGHPNSNNFASGSLEFLSRLMPKWGPLFFSFTENENVINIAIELALRSLSEADTLPRRCAATFFGSLVDNTGPGSKLLGQAQANANLIIQSHGPRILALILRLLCGECARSELESITEPLKKFIQRQQMLTKNVCKEAMRDGSQILSDKALKATDLAQRLRFVAQLESLRGSRKTNDIVKEFWVACKGSGFGYIA